MTLQNHTGDPDTPDRGNAQDAALELADAATPFDRAMLARASTSQRLEQLYIRKVLHHWADTLWDDIKARELDVNDDQYAGIAGLRDLTAELLTTVELSIHDAGENLPIDPDYDPEQTRQAEQRRKAEFGAWLQQASDNDLDQAQQTINPNDTLDLQLARINRQQRAQGER